VFKVRPVAKSDVSPSHPGITQTLNTAFHPLLAAHPHSPLPQNFDHLQMDTPHALLVPGLTLECALGLPRLAPLDLPPIF